MADYDFKNLTDFDPPEYLSGKILAKIESHKRKTARIKFFIFEFAGFLSLAIAAVSFKFALEDFYSSGFANYLSLIFSDWGIVMAYWKNFIMLLAESAPLLWLTAFLVSVFAMLESIKHALKNKKVIFLTNKFI